MQALLVEPPFQQFKPHQGQPGQVASMIAEVCDTSGLETTLSQAWPTLKLIRAPTMVTFLSQALQNQFSSKDSLLQTSVDESHSFFGLGNPNDDIVDLPLHLLRCHGRRMLLWCGRRIWESSVGNMELESMKSILGGS